MTRNHGTLPYVINVCLEVFLICLQDATTPAGHATTLICIASTAWRHTLEEGHCHHLANSMFKQCSRLVGQSSEASESLEESTTRDHLANSVGWDGLAIMPTSSCLNAQGGFTKWQDTLYNHSVPTKGKAAGVCVPFCEQPGASFVFVSHILSETKGGYFF